MIFKWKSFTAIQVDPQIAGEELERLTEENGGIITPAVLVESSRSEDAPLHKAFKWDDAEAAIEYRKDQARLVLRSIVIITNENREPAEPIQTVRAFIHSETEKGYCPIVRAMSSKELRREVLTKAWKELREWKERYEHLSEFSEMVEIIESRKTG